MFVHIYTLPIVAKSVATSRGTGPDTEAIASDVVDYDKTKVNEDNNDKENEQEDFLASLSQIPNLWYDLGKILTQPLRHKPTGTERDSYEYFGMVGKAPYILCPLGFKKNVKGINIYHYGSDALPFWLLNNRTQIHKNSLNC